MTVQRQVLRLLKQKALATGTAVLFISHDMAVVSQVCDRLYVMYAGAVIESGLTQQVLHHPLHPYSVGLLDSAPDNGEPRSLLRSIPARCRIWRDYRAAAPFANAALPPASCGITPMLRPIEQTGQQAACWYPQREKTHV